MKRFHWLVLPLLGLFGCADTVPVPDVFDAAFATGRFCIPSTIATGGANTQYPVRFVYNLYDCVNITPGTVRILTVFQGPSMVMLATAELTKDEAVEAAVGCDARDLENPPAGRFETITQDFNVSVPQFTDGTFATGPFQLTIPYLTLEEGQRLMDRLEAAQGDPNANIADIVAEEVGPQMYPGRQFNITFSETATPVANHDAIAESDCHDVPLP
jgi:hypothetical protein